MEALAAIREALSPEGTVIFSVPAIAGLYSARDRALGHHRRYDKNELVGKLTQALFRIVDCRFWNLIGVLPYWFYGKVLRGEIYDGLRKGQDSRSKRAAREILVRWLALEAKLPLPIGLSLVAVARRLP